MRWSDHGARWILPALALGLCLSAALAGCAGSTSTPAAAPTGALASVAPAWPAVTASKATSKAAGGMAACASVTRVWTEFLAGQLKATVPGESDFAVLTAALYATFAGDITLSNFPDRDIDALATASAAIAYIGVLEPQNEGPFNKRLAVVARDCGTTLPPLSA